MQLKVLMHDLKLLQDLFGNSDGDFFLVFTAPAKLEVELRAKIGHYRNRSLHVDVCPFDYTAVAFSGNVVRI